MYHHNGECLHQGVTQSATKAGHNQGHEGVSWSGSYTGTRGLSIPSAARLGQSRPRMPESHEEKLEQVCSPWVVSCGGGEPESHPEKLELMVASAQESTTRVLNVRFLTSQLHKASPSLAPTYLNQTQPGE